MRAIVLAELDGVHLKTIAGDIQLLDSEPSRCKVIVSNHAREYGPYSSTSAICEIEPRILTFRKLARVGSSLRVWVSPDFIVEDYVVGPGATIELSGRCRLAELDSDDQAVDVGGGVSTAENIELDDLATLLAAQGGLTITGLEGRLVRQYHVVGNLFSLLSDLLYPLEHFRMGVGSQIVCSRSPVGSQVLTDQDDLKGCVFRRSRYRQNQAVVERLESGGGMIELGSDEREGGALAGVSSLIALSEPSRSFWIEWDCRRGKMFWSAYDESGNPLNPPLSPLTNARYQGVVPATHVRFSYDLSPGAENGDVWSHWYRYAIYGWPSGVTAPPVAGYSAIGNAGAGPRRRFPQPFSLPSIDTHADAQAAANAIATEGNLEGASLALELSPWADVPLPFSAVNVTDYRTGVSGMDGIVKSATIIWDERPRGQNRITVEAGVSE